MKIWFITDAGQDNGQHGGHPGRQDSSVHPLSPQSRFPYNPQLHPACPPSGSRAQSRGRTRFSRAFAPPAAKKPAATTHFSAISNRFWPANRSHTKQNTKPCLTGTRTVNRDLEFPLRAMRDARFSAISTRFCSKSRSYTKHTTKPSLPGARIGARTAFSRNYSAKWTRNLRWRSSRVASSFVRLFPNEDTK
jgi:hypothetical protein